MKVITVKKVCPYCGHLNELRIAGTYHGDYRANSNCAGCQYDLKWVMIDGMLTVHAKQKQTRRKNG